MLAGEDLDASKEGSVLFTLDVEFAMHFYQSLLGIFKQSVLVAAVAAKKDDVVAGIAKNGGQLIHDWNLEMLKEFCELHWEDVEFLDSF